MQMILKYPVGVGRFTIKMPEGSTVVHAGPQRRGAEMKDYLWAMVEPSNPIIDYKFMVIGTGQHIPSGLKHVKTFQSPPFVWHLFEEI